MDEGLPLRFPHESSRVPLCCTESATRLRIFIDYDLRRLPLVIPAHSLHDSWGNLRDWPLIAAETTKRTFLHQGIAERNFKRQFRIADHQKVTGAKLTNGLLHVGLEREILQAMKPRQIPINGVVTQKFLKSA